MRMEQSLQKFVSSANANSLLLIKKGKPASQPPDNNFGDILANFHNFGKVWLGVA